MGHYVAVSPDQKAVILSFRGSNNNRNFMDAADVSEGQPEPNLYGVPVNNIDQLPPMPNRARLFNGFARSARSQIETAVEKLYDAYSKNPTYSVIITGHSLGGAVSQLAALYARIRYRKTMPLAAVYTYGKPIIGNALFEDWSVSIIHPTPFFRFVSSDDVVPLLWYDNNSRKTPESRVRHALGAQEVYCPDFSSPTMIVCKGELDSECSEMQDCTRLSWAHHSEYAGFRATKSVCLLAQFRKK
ncbi:Alpha/Beta hydrolase protein [Syncephalis fuscata]|nr:Alpha/Beta hydrolase protein [Syncephalis fuscata]